MAFTALNPAASPTASLWQRQGLTCLLQTEDLPEDLYYGADAPVHAAASAGEHNGRSRAVPGQGLPGRATSDRGASGRAMPDSGALPRSRTSQIGQTSQTGQIGQIAQTTRAPQPPKTPQSPQKAQAVPAGPAESLRPQALPPHSWPAPWRERLAASRPGLVVWTYWKLGQDVCGAGVDDTERAGRRDFFRRLFGDLGHPTGTHTFWPACLPNAAAEAEANAPLFWAGATALGARGVVVMGSAATKALGLPPGLRPLQQTRLHGLLVWVLWDVDHLLGDAQHYAPMSAFLRQALRPVVRA